MGNAKKFQRQPINNGEREKGIKPVLKLLEGSEARPDQFHSCPLWHGLLLSYHFLLQNGSFYKQNKGINGRNKKTETLPKQNLKLEPQTIRKSYLFEVEKGSQKQLRIWSFPSAPFLWHIYIPVNWNQKSNYRFNYHNLSSPLKPTDEIIQTNKIGNTQQKLTFYQTKSCEETEQEHSRQKLNYPDDQNVWNSKQDQKITTFLNASFKNKNTVGWKQNSCV
jgi:hypothetical protein